MKEKEEGTRRSLYRAQRPKKSPVKNVPLHFQVIRQRLQRTNEPICLSKDSAKPYRIKTLFIRRYDANHLIYFKICTIYSLSIPFYTDMWGKENKELDCIFFMPRRMPTLSRSRLPPLSEGWRRRSFLAKGRWREGQHQPWNSPRAWKKKELLAKKSEIPCRNGWTHKFDY